MAGEHVPFVPGGRVTVSTSTPPAEYANGGCVEGDRTSGTPWVEPGGCDYLIPKYPVDMPQLWDGDQA
jgi:hypothetical protein